MNPRSLPALAAGLLAAVATAASTDHAPAPPSIPEVASNAGRFQTLLAAAGAAGLADALGSPGPFTVFAPTDAAFARLGDETISGLLEPQAKSTLARILKHHVVVGRLGASELVGRDSVETLAGTTLELETLRGRLLVGEAAVETADIEASNGVIHVIDRVLIPARQIAPLETLLDSAVQRGAPLFNDGNVEACAATYATALEAASLVEAWGLDAETRQSLGSRLETIGSMADARERSWAYRRIIDTLYTAIIEGEIPASETPMTTTSATTSASPAASGRHSIPARGKMLFDFDSSAQVQPWRTVLDGVMGGRSTGRITGGEGTLVFDGRTSLENNGGFSSIRTNVPDGTFEGADAVRLIVKGDGRDYKLSVKGVRGASAGGYWRSFPTTADTWTEVVVPIAELDRQFMGRPLDGRISPESIRSLEFYIYDKKAGPFRLEVDSIEAVRLDDTFDA